jgi:hypothetical protein
MGNMDNRLSKVENQIFPTERSPVDAVTDSGLASRLAWLVRWAGISLPTPPWKAGDRAAVVRFAKLTIAKPGGIRVGGLAPLDLQLSFRAAAESCGLALGDFTPGRGRKPRPASSSSTETPQRPTWAGGDGASSYL